MTTDPLDQFIAALAEHLTHARSWPPDAAPRVARELVERARQEYQDSGASYGDDVTGFLRWLSERPPTGPGGRS
jgi:hypothetical protein